MTCYQRHLGSLFDELGLEYDKDNRARVDGALRRSVTFGSFLDGIAGVQRVAEAAERADHHPDIDIRWRTVTFALATHSEGGITDKDVELAREIDGLVGH